MLVDGYVRVSQVRGRSRPQFISPSEPAGPIRDWTALHGHTVANVWEQLDESVASADPATAPALASSEAILICNTVVEEPEGYLAPETHAEAAWARRPASFASSWTAIRSACSPPAPLVTGPGSRSSTSRATESG